MGGWVMWNIRREGTKKGVQTLDPYSRCAGSSDVGGRVLPSPHQGSPAAEAMLGLRDIAGDRAELPQAGPGPALPPEQGVRDLHRCFGAQWATCAWSRGRVTPTVPSICYPSLSEDLSEALAVNAAVSNLLPTCRGARPPATTGRV